jgi:hypothetical protein
MATAVETTKRPPRKKKAAEQRFSQRRQKAEAGQFELYKTTHQFDGTVANPQWLG